MPGIGQKRTYRGIVRRNHLIGFDVTVKETDLRVYAQKEMIRLTRERTLRYRGYIENYIEAHPEFAASLVPVAVSGPAPPIVSEMAEAGKKAGVGPMAAVAGAVAQFVGRALMEDPAGSPEVVIENGGDVFIKANDPITVAIFAGTSEMNLKLGLRIDATRTAKAVCTSSGTIGHSISLGRADAACVVSDSCVLADAAATAIGNRIKTKSDIRDAIAFGRSIEGVTGIVVILKKEVGMWGNLDVVPLK